MKKENRNLGIVIACALFATLVLAIAALKISAEKTRQDGEVKAESRQAMQMPRPPADKPGMNAAAAPTPVRRPSASALARWMKASNDDLAQRAEDYQLDAPRRRNELGEPEPFREHVMNAAQLRSLLEATEGSVVRLDLFPDFSAEVRVTGRWSDPAERRLVASVQDQPAGSRFSMSWMADQARGLLELPSRNLAYEILRLPSGQFVAREWLYSDKVCARVAPQGRSADSGMPLPQVAPGGANLPVAASAVPLRNSRPGAVAVIYLDFDGEVVAGSAWANGATIRALPARMNAVQIEETWRRVSNHFAVFDVNVTTDRAVYNAAPLNRKTHCVITPTDTAAEGAGGVAYLDSFTNPSTLTKVCWTFVDQEPADSALVCSHEIGHTLGLRHHGRIATNSLPREEYYAGHGGGETGWGPFMGAPYGKNLLQWSKGEYARANNSAQDDLAVVSTPARIPFLNDDHGGDLSTATLIQSGAASTGQVQRNTDSDFFKVDLDTGAQPVGITLVAGTMLDAEIKIYDSAGALLQTVNPAATLAAGTTLNLQIWGDVFVEIRGTGKAPVLGDGYSNYSSLGSYTLTAGSGSGTGPAIALVPSSLPGFRANQGTASASAALQVRARRLTGPLNVAVEAPFEVSTNNVSFSGSVQPAADTTVHVRLAASATAGILRKTLSASSSGATTRSLPLTGLVFGGPPDGPMSFVEDAMKKLHYFAPEDPSGSGFQRDYVLQFVDYVGFLESRLSHGLPEREARAETIMRMAGFAPGAGSFDSGSGYALTSVAFANFARLGLSPTSLGATDFVRTARSGAAAPVPMTVSTAGLNGLAGAPWGATMGMAEAMRDFFNSRAFRERYPSVRLMNSADFCNWMRDVMFPGRAMGAEGPAALLSMMDTAFTAGYPQLTERRAIARGAAAAFRSVYAGVLVTDARGSNDGSALEAPFLRRLNHAALRYQLWGDWTLGDRSSEFSKNAILDLLKPPVLNQSLPSSIEVAGAGGASLVPSVLDAMAPINTDVRFVATREDGTALPPGVEVSPTGAVTIGAGSLPAGAHRISITAFNLAGASAPRAVDILVAPPPAQSPVDTWMASHNLPGTLETATSYDADSFSLVMEYAFGLDPNRADVSAYSARAIEDGRTVIEWNALSSGARYFVEQSNDLRSWAAATGLEATVDLGAVGALHRRKQASIVRSGSSMFYRVRAELE